MHIQKDRDIGAELEQTTDPVVSWLRGNYFVQTLENGRGRPVGGVADYDIGMAGRPITANKPDPRTDILEGAGFVKILSVLSEKFAIRFKSQEDIMKVLGGDTIFPGDTRSFRYLYRIHIKNLFGIGVYGCNTFLQGPWWTGARNTCFDKYLVGDKIVGVGHHFFCHLC